MERVQRTNDNELIDVSGDIKIGMWGPNAKLEKELKDYREQYGEERVEEKTRITINGNTVVIIIRKID